MMFGGRPASADQTLVAWAIATKAMAKIPFETDLLLNKNR